MILYIKQGCPFCGRVLAAMDELGVKDQIELRDIADEGVVDELIERGGKKQEPFLYDEEKGVAMYESNDIIAYLEEMTGEKATPAKDTACMTCPI